MILEFIMYSLTRYEMVKTMANSIYIVKYHELEMKIIMKYYQQTM